MRQSQAWTIGLVLTAAVMIAIPALATKAPHKGGRPMSKSVYSFNVKTIDGVDLEEEEQQ